MKYKLMDNFDLFIEKRKRNVFTVLYSLSSESIIGLVVEICNKVLLGSNGFVVYFDCYILFLCGIIILLKLPT